MKSIRPPIRHFLEELKLFAPIRDAYRRGNVAMIHIGRCGSTVLGDLLDQHPGVAWDSEIYQQVFREREHRDHSLPPISDVDPVQFLRQRSDRVFSRFYGFEVKFFHLRVLGTDIGPFLAEVEEALGNMHFVLLRRMNTLRMILSTLTARKTGIWHLRKDRARIPDPVRVDLDAVFVNRENAGLLDLMREFSRDFSLTEELLRDRHSLRLSYEDDIQEDPREAYRKICDFLGLPASPVAVRFFRTNPVSLTEMIENFDEIREALAGTEFEWMLDE